MASSPLQNARSTKGAEDFLRLSKAMKGSAPELRKELNKALRTAAKPIIPKIRQSARSNLPREGGLNERFAKKPLRAAVRTGEKTAGVRIQGTKTDPRVNAQGRVAHPVFGRPRSTVVQQVPSAVGYFDRPAQDSAPQVRSELVAVLADFKKQLEAKTRGGAGSG